MTNDDNRLREEVKALNELGTEELDRWIKMHVLRVEPSCPDFVTKRKRRRLAPRLRADKGNRTGCH